MDPINEGLSSAGPYRRLPLSGTTVIELSPLLPVPFAGLLLADLGARVIKVERPPLGDPVRETSPAMFELVNRNKESVTLDLKHERAGEIIHRIAQRADVIIEGFRPGVADRLGAGYETLRRDRREIVYCSVSGFGQDGPYRDLPGHDATYLAWAGFLGVPANEGASTAARPGIPVADLAAGTHAALAIVAALLRRAETGEGSYVDVPIADIAFSWTAVRLALLLASPSQAEAEWHHFLGGQRVECKDGREIMLAITDDASWLKVCEAIGRQDLATSPRYASSARRNRQSRVIGRELRRTFRSRVRGTWLAVLREFDVPHAPIYEAPEVLRDAHVRARGLISTSVDARGRHPAVRAPARSSSWPLVDPNPPPILGGQNDVVLRELGYSPIELAHIIESGVCG